MLGFYTSRCYEKFTLTKIAESLFLFVSMAHVFGNASQTMLSLSRSLYRVRVSHATSRKASQQVFSSGVKLPPPQRAT